MEKHKLYEHWLPKPKLGGRGPSSICSGTGSQADRGQLLGPETGKRLEHRGQRLALPHGMRASTERREQLLAWVAGKTHGRERPRELGPCDAPGPEGKQDLAGKLLGSRGPQKLNDPLRVIP